MALESLWERVGGELLARVASLEEALAAVPESRLDHDLRARAERDAHLLAGSAGTFGRHEASSLARQLESLFAGSAPIEPGSLLDALHQVEQLRVELSEPPEVSPASGNDRPVLLIVHRDSKWAAAMGLAAEASGFEPRTADSLETARRALGAARPAVALVDLALPGATALPLVAELVAHAPPVATLAVTGDAAFTDRVEAVRMGVRGFVADSLPPAELAGAAAAVLEADAGERWQLVAVDDDPAILAALSALLEPSGLDVRGTTDPQQFWAVLDETAPDLAVLDLDLPGASGIELCRLLRADPRWAALPVVVLTVKADRATVESVFAAGADDFVVKPFLGPELLNRITNRLERTRILRAMAEVDPLTGLANRRKLEAQWARLQAMADRYGQPLSFALLDLDRFRRVNNHYGHDVGDTVLRRLAGLLNERFRGEDVVARWGGEEIALVLYGMTREDAARRVDEALEDVRRTQFRAPGGDRMRITFSAGVSEYRRDGSGLRQLYLRADEALYQAKERCKGSVLPAGRTRWPGR
jgi:diguanylate cyclase (GGDEF)-like protein